MSASAALANPPVSGKNWRATLAEIAARLEAEETRADAANAFVEANFTLLRERGFLGLAVPVELGGGGLDGPELAALLRELARHCSATALAFAMHTHLVAAAAWRWRHQKAPTDGLLRRVAAENLQLLSSGASDWLAGSGDATKVEGGYRINARKIFASGAPTANLLITGAVEQTAEGPVVLQFGVPMTASGVSIVETWDAMGMRGSASHDVLLKDVFIADAAIAARRPSGMWHPLMHTICMVAFPLVYAVYTGIAEAAYDIAVAAAKGNGCAPVDAVGALHNEWTATRIACDSMVAFASTAQPGPQTTSTIFTHRTLVARSAIKTVELALEAAGGASYFKRLGLERRFRDIQGARFHPMRQGDQRTLAGRVALGLPIDD
ncbi:acyl-CoA dehydrogenase family protein [Reyranella sp.]|uniref:acyl-CoA dehydrogenase family protein n=1 Tax=Reyranella sp. TaxID=1929291 RepID=UPI003D14D9A1